jgi:hypothetical protein
VASIRGAWSLMEKLHLGNCVLVAEHGVSADCLYRKCPSSLLLHPSLTSVCIMWRLMSFLARRREEGLGLVHFSLYYRHLAVAFVSDVAVGAAMEGGCADRGAGGYRGFRPY